MNLTDKPEILIKVIDAHKEGAKANKDVAFELSAGLRTPKPLAMSHEELAVAMEKLKMAVLAFPGAEVQLAVTLGVITPQARDISEAVTLNIERIKQEELKRLEAEATALKADAEAVRATQDHAQG